MNHEARGDPLFEVVKQLLIDTRIPSVSHVQVTFRIGYSRAANMLAAMEGDIVTSKDEHGMRRMLTGETKGDDGVIINLPDLVGSEMRSFDSAFFKELSMLGELELFGANGIVIVPPHDIPHDDKLRVSELLAAGKISNNFVRLIHKFVATLAKRSGERYVFETDFRVRPWQVYSYSKGHTGRKQLYIRFDAIPPNRIISSDWGVSIGLGFDFRNEHGIITKCVNEYEAFQEKVFCEQELFDATFGSLGGYAEPTEDFKEPITAEKAWQTTPDMLQSWLFFGRRLTPDAITAMSSLDGLADECIRVFNVISEAGYYHVSNDAK